MSVGLVAALAITLCGCSGLSSLKNPFAKAKVPLPGERIAVIADDGVNTIDKSAAKAIVVPPPNANAAWSQPGGVPANNLGNLALGDTLQKVWSADAGTGSSSKGTKVVVSSILRARRRWCFCRSCARRWMCP